MKLLEELISAFGISGQEEEVRQIIRREIEGYVDSIEVDRMGNLIAHKKGTEGFKVMLTAHMDEVGLMVNNITEGGFITCSSVGGIEASSLIGAKVQILTSKGTIYGIVTTAEMSNDGELSELPSIEDLIVDTGLRKNELEKKGVEIGTYVELEKPSYTNFGKKVVGKSMDDRVGCYILCKLIKKAKDVPLEIYYVFTVQEEIGLYGAKTSAYTVAPDWGVVVDVASANDVLASSEKRHIVALGQGPCLTVMDDAMIAPQQINTHIKKVAKQNKIPLQFEISSFGTTEATSIQTARGGVPASIIGVPVRNLHSTISMAHQRDIKNCIKLLHSLLKDPPKIMK
ncbi:hypothetical protein KKA47_04970 [bacterium]|nr:hypothetical protein [bacterium]